MALIITDIPVVAGAFSEIIKTQTGITETHFARRFTAMKAGQLACLYELVVFELRFELPGAFAALLDFTRSRKPATRFLVIAAFRPNTTTIKRLYNAGVSGLLFMDDGIGDIQGAIRKVYKGGLYIDRKVLAMLFLPDSISHGGPGNLTQKEAVIARLMVEGKSNMQICDILALCPSTVSTFKTRIYTKLHVKNVIELEKASRYLLAVTG